MNIINSQLYVGTVEDFYAIIKNRPTDVQWSILGACKEPLHRKYAKIQGAPYVGYKGRAMSKDEPEYLFAKRNHALYCNLIDPTDIKYIPDKIINECMAFIDEEISQCRTVLIVCNKAESRSPSIALMWLIHHGEFDTTSDWENVLMQFMAIYPNYNPGKGFLEYTKNFWEQYKEQRR